MSMNFDRIGAIAVRIGANAVARLFLSRSKLPHNIEIAELVEPDSCAKFDIPATTALLSLLKRTNNERMPRPYFNNVIIPFLAFPAALPVSFSEFAAFFPLSATFLFEFASFSPSSAAFFVAALLADFE